MRTKCIQNDEDDEGNNVKWHTRIELKNKDDRWWQYQTESKIARHEGLKPTGAKRILKASNQKKKWLN